jgi:hypothetical protein
MGNHLGPGLESAYVHSSQYHGSFGCALERFNSANMVVIRFPNPDAKRRALAYLVGRFPFRSWATGEVIVPEAALPELAVESAPFSVEGPAKYQQYVPTVRNSASASA